LSEELGEPIFRRRRVSAGGNDRHLSVGPYELGRDKRVLKPCGT
jgi:hypothetical protein